jgi:hypothetical protein
MNKEDHLMKNIIAITVMSIFLLTTFVFAGEKAPQKVFDLANKELAKHGDDAVIKKAAAAENAKGRKLDQVKEMDKKWMATAGLDEFMKGMMESECGKHISKIQKSAPYFSEIFLTDNLGANVCMTDKTSDYWQGDEPKFTDAFSSGNVTVSDVKFDKSSQTYSVHVSVPVKDGGAVIGVLIMGVDIDKVK